MSTSTGTVQQRGTGATHINGEVAVSTVAPGVLSLVTPWFQACRKIGVFNRVTTVNTALEYLTGVDVDPQQKTQSFFGVHHHSCRHTATPQLY